VLIDLPRFIEERNPEEVEEIQKLIRTSQSDFVILDIEPDKNWKPRQRDSLYLKAGSYSHLELEDEWGAIWKETRVVKHPLGDGWDGDYAVPNPHGHGRFEKAKELISLHPDQYHLGRVWFTLFERLWIIRGFNNMLLDPYLNHDKFVDLRDRVMAYDIGLIDEWLSLDIDGIYISDDWGGQTSLLINPEDWRRLYKPCYRQIVERVHRKNVDLWMHSCGCITEIIPDLIEIGVDVLNPIQPRAMDLEYLSKTFAGRICFYGGVDVQGTLPYGTPQEVREEVKRLIRLFYANNGGYIAETSHTILPDTPIENIRALYMALEEFCTNPDLTWKEV
jgi:uroporphyrinogen decarboxylase